MQNSTGKFATKCNMYLRVFFARCLNILRLRVLDLPPSVQYRANLLQVIIYGHLCVTLTFLAYSFLSHINNSVLGLLGGLTGIMINLWALSKLQQGDMVFSGRLIMGTTWLSLAAVAYVSGGVYSSAMLGFMAILVVGILLLDKRAKNILFVTTIIYFFILLGLELSGHLPYTSFNDLPLRIVVLILSASTLYGIVYRYFDALQASEKNLAKLQLEAQNNELRQSLTQDLAHDLRTPISVLKTSAYLIRQKQEKNLPFTDAIDRLEMQADKLNQMIDELFQLTVLDDVDPHRTLSIVNIKLVMVDCIRHALPLAQQNNIQLEWDEKGLVDARILGDQRQVRRVFDNLIENAIHYGRPNGFVHLRLSNKDQRVVFTVTDNGIGISHEDQTRIFDRFFRADAARKARQTVGTGIGLNSVRRIVELHDGIIEVQSEVDKGTTFTVSFPSFALPHL